MLFLFFGLYSLLNSVKVQAKDFRNIIFDLGGVIINLDEDKTVREFARMSQLSASQIKQFMFHFEAYHLFEKGLLSPNQFREIVRKEFRITSSDAEIDHCLNAMLLDIPAERLDLLKSLTDSSLFLLSNTNAIHLSRFKQIFKQTKRGDNFDSFFQKAYYSHLVKMRKPDPEIFKLVINENGLNPSETLFLDDNINNLKGAQSVGIHTFHVENPDVLFKIFQ